jgi:MoaA/NifB/PqqE/SkfB family radical SAM enzyme
MNNQTQFTFNPRFRFALVLLTNRCNLACKHCYVESGPKGHEGLERHRVLRLIDEMSEQYGQMYFSLSGGEALVRTDDCLAVLEKAVEQHHVQLVSNGTLISPEIAAQLARLKIAIKISLDGAGPETHDWMRGQGSFADTMRGIENLLQAGFPATQLAFGATIPTGKVAEVGGILRLAESFGVSKVRVDSVAKMGRARYFWPHNVRPAPDPQSLELKNFFDGEFPDRHGSEWRLVNLNEAVGMFETLHVYYDGEVHVYLNYDHPIAKEGCIGNLNESSLREMTSGPKVQDAIIRRFLQFARMPERSFISYYAVRGPAADTRLWFESEAEAA